MKPEKDPEATVGYHQSSVVAPCSLDVEGLYSREGEGGCRPIEERTIAVEEEAEWDERKLGGLVPTVFVRLDP